MFPVVLRALPEHRLAALAHRGPYAAIGGTFEKLGASVATRGLFGQVGRMIAVYHDDPVLVPPADLRSHAGFEVPSDLALAPPLEELRLSAGRHAVLIFTGPYAGLQTAYDHLFGTWLPQSGEARADGPVFEIYLNTPMDTAPADLVTEICLPLR